MINFGRYAVNADKSTYSLVAKILFFLPVMGLLLNLVGWLRFGVDVPFFDDWRAIATGFSVSWRELFLPSNDTLYPVGKLLDFVAFKLLAGNTLAYQFISMLLCLGGLLFLQWKLLALVVDDRFARAFAFLFTLYMLQPDSYWGMQAMAYHQAIPLICVLAILYLALQDIVSMRKLVISIVLLGFVSGLAYISGAFAIFVLAIVFLYAAWQLEGDLRLRFFSVGRALMVPGIITVALQLWVIVGVQHGSHLPDVPMAFPYQADFWIFILGEIGRSLMLVSDKSPLFAIGITLLCVVVGIFVGGHWIATIKSKNGGALVAIRPAVIYLALSAVIMVYLCLIAAGRMNMQSPTIDSRTFENVFFTAYNRFHFFWATLIWPWVMISLWLWVRPSMRWVIVLPSLLILIGGLLSGYFNHMKFYRADGDLLSKTLSCVINYIPASSSVCALPLTGVNHLVVKAAVDQQISFTRFLRLPVPHLGSGNLIALLTGNDLIKMQAVNVQRELFGDFLRVDSESVDPMLLLSVNKTDVMAACHSLRVSVLLRAGADDTAQLFFTSPSAPGLFSEPQSARIDYTGSVAEWRSIVFTLFNADGFADTLRFDPGATDHFYEIKQVDFVCEG